MNDTGLLLGLLADQQRSKGVRLPFLGHDCSTSTAPAVFALRYNCPLHTAICYRTGLAKWRIEVGDEIPTRENGQPRPIADIMRDVNRAFESRRAPRSGQLVLGPPPLESREAEANAKWRWRIEDGKPRAIQPNLPASASAGFWFAERTGWATP